MPADVPSVVTSPVAPGQRTPAAGPPRTAPGPPRRLQVARRRRPSGEPPPLPKQLHRSGLGWLVVACATVGVLTGFALASGTRSVLDRIDRPVLVGLVEIRTPWLTDVMHVLGAPATERGV